MDQTASLPADQAAIKVLVVDDEAVIASEIVEFLSFEDIGAVAARDGHQAMHYVDAASPGAFTVMITDVRMPGINGLELANDIRTKASEVNAIEVILMTGHGSHKVVQDATRIPAFECMAKPLSLSHLLTTIRRAHAATVVRRMNHRESIDETLRWLERARRLADRAPAHQAPPPSRPSAPAGQVSDTETDGSVAGGPDHWRWDPLGFVLSREDAAAGAEPAIGAADHDWYDAALDRAAEQARATLVAIGPLTDLITGRRLISRTTVSLRTLLEALAQRHDPAISLVTATIPDRQLYIDEQILAAILDQVVDDVARSGPNAIPILIEVELDEATVKIRTIGCSTGPVVHAARLPSDDSATSHRSTVDTGGLGLRIATAAARLLGSTIERKGTCNGYCTTTVVVSAAATPTEFGVD